MLKKIVFWLVAVVLYLLFVALSPLILLGLFVSRQPRPWRFIGDALKLGFLVVVGKKTA